MTKRDCEICRGAGCVPLPIYRRAMAAYAGSIAPVIEESSREYPCPECGDAVPETRLAIVHEVLQADSRYRGASDFMETAKETAAARLAAGLVGKGFIKVEQGPDDADGIRFSLRATIGVVSSERVASLEERIAAAANALTSEVIAEADSQINNWGSHYGYTHISKDQAMRCMREAFATVTARRAAFKMVA